MDLEPSSATRDSRSMCGSSSMRDEAAEIGFLDLAAQEDVGADIEIVGERQVLIDRLDPLLARIDRAGEVAAPPSK